MWRPGSRHRYVGQSRVIRMRDLSRSDRSAGRLRLKRWRVLDLSSFFALRLFFSYSKEWQQADASTSVGWRNFDLSEYFFFKYLETISSNRAFLLMKTQNSSPLFSLNFCQKLLFELFSHTFPLFCTLFFICFCCVFLGFAFKMLSFCHRYISKSKGEKHFVDARTHSLKIGFLYSWKLVAFLNGWCGRLDLSKSEGR